VRRFNAAVAAFLSIFAFGAAAAAAQAEEAPFWLTNGARLTKGASRSLDAKVHNGDSFSLTTAAAGTKITCTSLADEKGLLLGSNEGEAGKSSAIIKFSGCTLVEGNGAPECSLSSSTITTEPLTGEQVTSVASSKRGTQVLEELRATTPAKGLALITFTGTKCTVTESKAAGQMVAEDRLVTAGEGTIELEAGIVQGSSLLLKFPATPIKEIWLIASGTGKVQKTSETFLGDEAVQTGTALVSLEGEEAIGVQDVPPSTKFTFTVNRPRPRRNEIATFTITNNNSAGSVLVISLSETPAAEYTPRGANTAKTCEKAYAANQVCSWEMEFTGTSRGAELTYGLVDSERRGAGAGVVAQ
jgi:hypothetical protein